MDKDESRRFLSEFVRFVSPYKGQFISIIVDAREFVPVSPEVFEIMLEINLVIEATSQGGARIATIINSPVVKNMAKRLGFASESSVNLRSINASTTNDPEKIAYEWAVNGIEPPSLVPAECKADL